MKKRESALDCQVGHFQDLGTLETGHLTTSGVLKNVEQFKFSAGSHRMFSVYK